MRGPYAKYRFSLQRRRFITNGKLIKGRFILTVDSEDRVIDNGGVVVREDRIVAVGDGEGLEKEHLAARSSTRCRHAVIPGLVSLHALRPQPTDIAARVAL